MSMSAALETTLNLARRPRYLIVLNDVGFLYSHFWGLAVSVQKAGWDVIIAAREGTSPQRAIDAGMQFIPVKLKVGIGSPAAEIRSAMALRAAIVSGDPDLIHLVSLKNVLLGGILAQAHRVKAVLGAVTGLGSLFVEEKFLYSLLRPVVMCGLKRVFRGSNAVMALENPDDRMFFTEAGIVAADRAFIVPGSGLESDAIIPSPHSGGVPVILCVSRMIRNKGIFQLIEAARMLRRDGLVFELQLAGDIDEDNPTSLTRAELKAAESNGEVKWLGRRSDVPELLSRATIFCLPTYYREGLPRALVEASAAGCAIVTTDVPGCREVVVNGRNGLLVPPCDVPALADALRSLLSDLDACHRMGMEARRRFEESFTRKSVFAAFNKCYAALNLAIEV